MKNNLFIPTQLGGFSLSHKAAPPEDSDDESDGQLSGELCWEPDSGSSSETDGGWSHDLPLIFDPSDAIDQFSLDAFPPAINSAHSFIPPSRAEYRGH